MSKCLTYACDKFELLISLKVLLKISKLFRYSEGRFHDFRDTWLIYRDTS